MAKEIESPYYETSVFTHFGVNEVFENVIRVALIARRQQRFWMTNLKHVQKSLLQEPFCPPQPIAPKVIVPNSQFDQHLSSLLQYQTYTDTILSIGKSGICAHKVVLSAASKEFYKLLTLDITAGSDYSNALTYSARSNSDSSIASSTDTSTSVGNFNTDTEQLLSSSPATLVDHGHINKLYMFGASLSSCRSGSANDSPTTNCNFIKKRSNYRNSDITPLRTGVHKTLNHPLFQSISIELTDTIMDQYARLSSNVQTVVAMSNVITLNALKSFVRFIYSANLNILNETPMSELYDIADLLDLKEFQSVLRNLDDFKESDVYFNQSFVNEFKLKMRKNLKIICMDEQLFAGMANSCQLIYLIFISWLFADVVFKLDDGTCSGHKAILMSRSDVMDAMFSGDFKESSARVVSIWKSLAIYFSNVNAEQIPFPGVNKETFRQMLFYMYTDTLEPTITHTNCLALIELANRLCLSRLVALVESQVIGELLRIKDSGNDISEMMLRLLESCQLHNADQLSEFCLHQIATNYNEICHKNTKLLRSLHPENQAYLNRNRWPPIWYLKEFDFYERCVRERLWQEKPKGLKRHRLNSGCLCFSGKNRRNESRKSVKQDLI